MYNLCVQNPEPILHLHYYCPTDLSHSIQHFPVFCLLCVVIMKSGETAWKEAVFGLGFEERDRISAEVERKGIPEKKW